MPEGGPRRPRESDLDRTLTLVMTEFGRRVDENGGDGTDHVPRRHDGGAQPPRGPGGAGDGTHLPRLLGERVEVPGIYT
jgi:Protein of unknown function (DUF1501)